MLLWPHTTMCYLIWYGRLLDPYMGNFIGNVTDKISQVQYIPFNMHTVSQWIYKAWWRHQMETFSALLAICAGNSQVPGEFPTQRPVKRSFDAFFDLRLNKRLSKQSWGWWLVRYRAHYDVIVMVQSCYWSMKSNATVAPYHYVLCYLVWTPIGSIYGQLYWQRHWLRYHMYSISHITCTLYLMLCFVVVVFTVCNGITFCICPYGLGLLHWHRGSYRGYPAKRALSAMGKHGG